MVSCTENDDGELLVVQGWLAVSELGTGGWLLVSWIVVDGRLLMAAKCAKSCSMLGCNVKNSLAVALGQVNGFKWG